MAIAAGILVGVAAWTVPEAACAVPPLAPCGESLGLVVDRGLHREWVVERDCAHPDRPARLVEVPWNQARKGSGQQPGIESGAGPGIGPASMPALKGIAHQAAPGHGDAERRPALQVRAGMTVTLWWRSREAQGSLTGIALDAGARGDRIWVKAGLHGAALRGVVRGPGQVELIGGGAIE